MSGADGKLGLNYRRRVIYRALQETFRDPQVVRGYFERWQRDHSHEAHFVVTRFAAVVAKEAGFDAQQKSQFQRRLFQGLTQSYDTLPRVPDGWIGEAPESAEPPVAAAVSPMPDTASNVSPSAPSNPPAAMPEANPAAQTTLSVTSPERVVFAAFAQPLCAAIVAKADRHPGVLRQAVGDLSGGDTDHERALMERFRLWAETRFRMEALPPLRHADDLRSFAHWLYLLAADLIGPVQADRLLADAAAGAARLPEAALFSPQLLL
ncbi:MAG: hypothetical protein KA144_05655 [Xanthomonadaceae bacterium]|nr:hypothetical protein [Xanthomonadaceae bacterium]